MKKKKSSNTLTSKKVVIDASQTKISSYFGSANNVIANKAQNVSPSSSQVQMSQETSPSKPTRTKTESPILKPKSPNVLHHSYSSPCTTFNTSSVIPPTPEFPKKTTSVTYIPPSPDVPVQLDESANSTTWIPPTPHPQKSPINKKILTKIRTPSSKSSPSLSGTSANVRPASLPRCKRSLIASDSTGLSPDKKKVAVSKIEETQILEDSFDNILADIDLSNCISKRVCFTDLLDTPKPPKSPERTSVSDYLELGRHVVEWVDHFSQDEIVLHLANKKICRLRNMWLHSTVKAGDVINIQGNWVQNECIVDHEQGLVVIQPDILISGTSVVASIFCMRKAVLAERVKRPFTNKAMLVGTLVHEMLQKSMQKPEECGRIEAMIDELLGQSANLQELYALNLSETEMRRDLESYVPQIRYIIDKYLFGKNVPIPEPVPCTQSRTRKPPKPVVWPGKISQVRDIEENVWSPRLGIKGKIDLTVEVAVHSRARKIVPFELKTGRSSFSAEHRGQLTLYSMMLSERHPDPEGGLLLYLKDCAMNDVSAGTKEKSQLIQLRNEMVLNILAPPFEKEGILTEASLPLPIDRASACEKCDYVTVCSLYQQANSAIPEAPHDMATLVPRALAHLTSAHIDFYRHWSLLMRLENMEILKKNKTKDLWSKTPQERENMGSCLTDCVISLTVPVGDQWEVSFVRPNALFNLAGIHCHENVLISCQKWIAIATGHVTHIDATTITVLADKNLNLYKGETFFIDRMEYQGGMAGLMGYLSALMEDNPRAAKLRELIVDKVQPVFKQGLNKRLTKEGKPILSALNLSQQRSLLVALTAQDYCLIHGMPGTGKTQVIVALIRLAVMLGQSVLVTSTTHSAVDNVFLRLLPCDLPILRLGQDYRVHPALRPFTEKALLGSCTNLDQFERVYNRIMVVGTTCLGSGHALLRRRNFSICIVDEAGQALLPSTLGPLFRAEKFVLVGDPLQLPPIVQSERAKTLGLEESLFVCLAQGGAEKAILPLQMQYRMCGPIMDVANALVYGGKLQAGNETVSGARLNIAEAQVFAQFPAWVRGVLQPEQPVVWVDTSQIGAHETRLLRQGGTVNEFEQKLVYYLVQALIKVGVAVGTVGVIAPYQSQVQGIRRNLEKIWPNLEINTVDQYQGKDKDVLLYSCTRSAISNDAVSRNNTRGDILDDLRRLTVAVTRAKLKLILMGNSSTFKSYAPFGKLLSILESSQMYKLCTNVDEFAASQVTDVTYAL